MKEYNTDTTTTTAQSLKEVFVLEFITVYHYCRNLDFIMRRMGGSGADIKYSISRKIQGCNCLIRTWRMLRSFNDVAGLEEAKVE